MESWVEKFGEVNLHGKVVGDKCIDWANDHQVVIGTNKKVVVCDMSMLISANKSEEVGFMIENVPVITEKTPFVTEEPSFVETFKNACGQTSNTKATPNYDVYKYFMDPSMYERKQTEYKGFRSVKFSHPLCTSLTGTELLAVLSLDYSLGIYHKVSAGKHGRWVPLCNLMTSLVDYLQANSEHLPNFEVKSGVSEYKVFREKCHSSSINNIAWSDIYSFLNQRLCYLAASTLNGYIVVWKFLLDNDNQFNPQIVDFFSSGWTNVADIAWQKDISNQFQPDNKALGIVVSNCEGQILCRKRLLSLTGDSTWTNCLKGHLWEEEDRLAARNIHWINFLDKSLVITSKSHVLAVWLLDDNLDVICDHLLDDAHSMPVVCLNVFEKDGTIQCYSSSSDGLLSLVDVNVYPTLELHVNRILARPTDIGGFRVISPSTLHETAISPNKAFMIMLTSRPHVRLSIQVDNEASIFMKRLISPKEAAEKLLQIVHSGSDVSLYKYLDLIEITSQHYAMTRKFDSALESFLSEGNIKQEYSIPNLQLRWYLYKLKKKANKCSKRTSLVEEMRPVRFPGEEECKEVEEVLIVRQITKVLILVTRLFLERREWSLIFGQTWFYHSVDHADTNLPIVPLLKVMGTKEDLLLEKDAEIIRNIRNLPELNNMPVQQTCAFTGLPTEISSDCRSAISTDGSSVNVHKLINCVKDTLAFVGLASDQPLCQTKILLDFSSRIRWPICCLTFNLLQGYEKRKCELSGLYSAFPDSDNPSWINNLLNSPCIFSGAPLRRYIN